MLLKKGRQNNCSSAGVFESFQGISVHGER
jgi:hypothetical protein